VASQFSRTELEQAQHAIASMLHKLSKSQQTMEAKGSIKPGSSQQTLMGRRVAALKVADALIQEALEGLPMAVFSTGETGRIFDRR
jgi:hypothetical protein